MKSHGQLWAAAGVAMVLCSCSKSGPEVKSGAPVDEVVPITVATVELIPMNRTLSVVGTLVAKDESTVGAEVEGKVEKTSAEFGDRLKAGQELALVDTDSYEALALQADANLAKAKASAVNAEQNLKRTESLQKEKIASESDLDKDTAGAEQARAEVKSAEAANAIAHLNLKRSHVLAPFECAVAERIASMGDYLKVGMPLFRVVNDNLIKFTTQVPESYAHDVQKDQLVALSVDGWTNTFEGRVFLISPQVNTATRDFPIAALVDNADHRLKANGFARGELVLARDVPTPMIPVESVINFAGITRTFVVDGDVARSRPVTVGRINEGRQEIVAGLKTGDIVVVSGQTKLHDGSKIRIKTQEEPAAASEDKKTRP